MDKKLSQETNRIINLLNDVRLYGIEDSTGTPTSGYIEAPDLLTAKSISDTDGDTYIKVEETADDDIINMKSGLTSGTILKLKNGSSTEVFQVDVNGILANNGTEYYQYIASNTHVFGGGDIRTGTGNSNSFLGHAAARNYTTGANNTIVGFQAALNLSAGGFNSILGNTAGYQVGVGGYNVYLGTQAGYSCAGDYNIRIGFAAGRHTNSSNELFIDNQNRGDTATEKTNSIIYGIMAAAPANQDLTFNANVFLSQVKSGATQVGAGAAANEIWKTASHATLPDNVLMIGV